ncbi:MSMEG_1061 family FMN-dependent PPOX-type flavoprotein [Psychromonas hadalis]|uniref:MSMEG_1061 family FMN-dependent PPOX-type flavoprotein n=1 Tax=Psychromonas hadalis TaxID=211669 RepID=UPI0003B3F8C8|nr:MSMEG_1061 family FMN-dependent PPOX-type flavoprotein [Psychromonas hadalis]
MFEIKTEQELREIIGSANPMASKKIYPFLNERMVNFIEKSPLLMLSTVDQFGFPTISPKGDKAGFVQIDKQGRLLIPELRGNKLAFSLTNILQHPQVALFFMVPGSLETLRIHGECRLLTGELLCKKLASHSHNALLVLEVTVKNAYFHCAKALLRSQLWQSATWPEPIKISFGKEIAENSGADDAFIEQVDKAVAGRYVTDL